MTKLIVAFLNFANALRKLKFSLSTPILYTHTHTHTHTHTYI